MCWKSLFCLSVLLLPSSSGAEVRTWTDATGKYRVEAEFVGVADGTVRLREVDGRVIPVPLSKLSADDQHYVRRMSERKPPKPETADPEHRDRAETRHSISEDRQVEQLLFLATSPIPEKRKEAVEKLAQMAKDGTPVARRLCQLTMDKKPKVRQSALQVLNEIEPQIAGCVEPLLRIMQQGRPETHMSALTKLKEMEEDGAPSVPVVTAFLTWFLRDNRYSFVYGITAVEVLGSAAHEDVMAMEAIKAVATIRPIRTEKQSYASREAMRQISYIARKHPAKRKELIPVLVWGLSETDPPNPLVDSLAVISIEALGEIGPDAKEAIPKLMAFQRHHSPLARTKAAEAIAKIQEEK